MGIEEFFGYVNEKLSPEELAEVERKLATPTLRPGDFDGTLEAWLVRISLWGKINIFLNDPENGIRNRRITKEKFLDIIDDPEDKKAYGLWDLDQKGVDHIVFYRKYIAYNGKKYTKELHVKVDLKDSLKKALYQANRKKIFGWF